MVIHTKAESEEQQILQEVCKKYQIPPSYIKRLIEIEKEYADRNMGRRAGITTRIVELVDSWVEECETL
jgi:hemerythrin superfamily protein